LLLRKKHFQRIFVIILALAIIPAALEFGARVVYAVRLKNSSFIKYPHDNPFAANVIRVRSGKGDKHTGKGLAQATFQAGPGPIIPIPINKDGFRGIDFSQPTEANYRVVAMGGSSTFSPECPPGTSYPEILGRLWNEELGASSVEVVNRAMIGMSSAGILKLLVEKIASESPDLITLNGAYNDASSLLMMDFYNRPAPWHLEILWGKSLFYTALFNTYLINKHRATNPADVVIGHYRRNLRDIVQTARKNGIRLLFIVEPIRPLGAVGERRPLGRPNYSAFFESSVKTPIQELLCEKMIEVAAETGTPIIDPRPALAEHPRREELFVNFLHLTPVGAEVMAHEIVKLVDEKYGGLASLVGQ
jgi:lysophospholipase L1-like esterase